MFYTSLPSGWLQINRADKVREILVGLRAVDPGARRVYPEQTGLDTAKADDNNNFLLGGAGPMLAGIKKFAYFQAHIDMARIACRLERYRLAHGTYPESLDALVPAYGAGLPHDVVSGQPYIYRLEKDGNYLLYSVGWNQKDDHGDATGPEFPGTPHFTDSALDWLWNNHLTPKK
jgi:hypothetical protein